MDISGNEATIVTKLLGGDGEPISSGDDLARNFRACWEGFGKGDEICDAKPRSRSDLARKIYATQKPVKTLVAKNLRSKIWNASDKDQFVMFYSQADRGLMRQSEEYNAFSGRYYMEETLEFFKFDVELNDVTMKQLDVKDTPVVYFFPAHDKHNPVKFKGTDFVNEKLFEFLRKVRDADAAYRVLPSRISSALDGRAWLKCAVHRFLFFFFFFFFFVFFFVFYYSQNQHRHLS